LKVTSTIRIITFIIIKNMIWWYYLLVRHVSQDASLAHGGGGGDLGLGEGLANVFVIDGLLLLGNMLLMKTPKKSTEKKDRRISSLRYQSRYWPGRS